MTTDFAPLDWFSLAVFLLIFFGYGYIARLLTGGGNLNSVLHQVRRSWMQRMMDRPDRIVDSALTGHTVASISFFSSATILVIAGLLGLLGKTTDAYRVISSWFFVTPSSTDAFQLKLVGLIAIFVYGFFRFTWALRQYNYCCALIGAAPLAKDEHPHRGEMADQVAIVYSSALASFGAGIRCYYFALAWLAWLSSAIAFLAAIILVLLVLLRRQTISHSVRAIRRYMELNPPDDDTGNDRGNDRGNN